MVSDFNKVQDHNQPSSSSNNDEVSPVILYAVAGVGAGIIIVVIIGAAILIHRCGKNSGNAAALDRINKNSYMSGDGVNGTIGSKYLILVSLFLSK